MPVDDLHRRVAEVALRAARRYGFALGGGNALIVHGIVSRATDDVDLFTADDAGVAAAADAVEQALRAAGYGVERRDRTSGIADLIEGMDDGLAEWVVTVADRPVLLQMAHIDRHLQPVTVPGVGPVLAVEDVIASKVCALAGRGAPRDYIDAAAAIGQGFSVSRLIELARGAGPRAGRRGLRLRRSAARPA